MLNYRVPAKLLLPYVPAGTELDLWDGAAYASIVGFHFRNTRIAGISIPLHKSFEEVNLRIYIRRVAGGESRRAVTFIRELVPRRAIAVVAKLAYNEPYRAAPMRHRIDEAASPSVAYEWKTSSHWSELSITTHGNARPLDPGSEEEFITQHYWGYTRQRDGGTVEYEVRHPSWNVWRAATATLNGDLSAVYPREFLSVLESEPYSAFLADGSAVSVHTPTRLSL